MSFPYHPIRHQAMRFYSGAIGWPFPAVQTIPVLGTLPSKSAFIPAGTLSPPPHTHTHTRNIYLCLRHNPLSESDSGSSILSRCLLRSFRYRSVTPQPPPNTTSEYCLIGTLHSNLESCGDDTTSCFCGALDLPAALALSRGTRRGYFMLVSVSPDAVFTMAACGSLSKGNGNAREEGKTQWEVRSGARSGC